MSNIFIMPSWFFEFSVSMGLLFALSALAVAYYSYKIYNLSGQKESLIFSWGFILISASYLIRSLTSLVLFKEINPGIRAITLENLTYYGLIGVYGHFVLFILGLITIAYTTFKVRCKRVYTLLIFLSFLSLYLCNERITIFYAVSSLFLVYICTHYAKEYIIEKNGKTAIVFLAFLLLLFGGIEPLIINSYLSFVMSNIMELGAYILITLNLLLTIRKRK